MYCVPSNRYGSYGHVLGWKYLDLSKNMDEKWTCNQQEILDVEIIHVGFDFMQ